ncbi:MAG: lipase [Pseudanabaenaceae cyanobacterium bins.68]|nr:lipase [Pseudanabaenaceae cyanobacterium bins.68]
MANFLPAVILPGYLADQADYLPLAKNLASLGVSGRVVPLRWWEWLPTVGGRSVVPILTRLAETIRAAKLQYKCDRVNLIAHSAGGWIARIYLGDVPYYDRLWQGRSEVACLVSLGTPQVSLEPWASKNLDFVNRNYPGAFYPELEYVCVAGKAVLGEKKLAKWLAYSSYELTSGDGNCWGDGIIPIGAAHLEGANNLILAGAQHSPRSGLWYGSAALLSEWVKYLATS